MAKPSFEPRKAKKVPLPKVTPAPRSSRAPPPKVPRRKTDITLPPHLVEKMMVTAKKMNVSLFEAERLALHAFCKYRIANPVDPAPVQCPACGNKIKPHREPGDFARIRVTVYFSNEDYEWLTWLADNYYRGVFARAFQAACEYFLFDGKVLPA